MLQHGSDVGYIMVYHIYVYIYIYRISRYQARWMMLVRKRPFPKSDHVLYTDGDWLLVVGHILIG